MNQGPRWIWKDGKNGYEAFLISLSLLDRSEVVDHATFGDMSVFSFLAVYANHDWKQVYESSAWFGTIYRFLLNEQPSPPLPAGLV